MFQVILRRGCISCISLLVLIACSPVQERSQAVSDSTSLKKTVPAESAEIVIETCEHMQDTELATLLGKYELQIKRRVSPTIVVVHWKDDRRPDAVIRELKGLKTLCTIQKNYRYQIIEKQQNFLIQ